MAQHDDKEAEALLRTQQKVARNLDAEIDSAISKAAETLSGREFLWWLLQVGKVDTQPFTPNALNMAFGCGEMNVGLQIKARINKVNPAVLARMMQEHEENGRTRPDSQPDADPSSDSSGG